MKNSVHTSIFLKTHFLQCLALLTFLLLNNGAVIAWDADLDLSFHSSGKSWVGMLNASQSGYATAVAVQTDGKIVLAGSGYNGTDSDFAVVRLGLDGYPDQSFGLIGRAAYDFGEGSDFGRDMVIQSDGKIVVVGDAIVGGMRVMAVVRFHTDGSLDDSVTVPFSGTANGYGVALQPDGKIVLSGRTYYANSGADFAVARLNTNLTMDTSFSSDGMADWDFGNEGYDCAYGVAVRKDGKIVTAGTADFSGQSVFGLIVWSATGGPLNLGIASFSAEAYGYGLDLQQDGKAVVSGRCETNGGDFAIARFNTNGTIDSSFGSGGMGTFSHLESDEESAVDIIVQHNGKILTTGYLNDGGYRYLALVRWDADGELDWYFNGGTPLYVYSYMDFFTGYDAQGAALFQQPDGKVVAAGSTNYEFGQLGAVARIMGDEDLIFVDGLETGTVNWWSSALP